MDFELQHFYRSVKLRGYFKDAEQQKATNLAEQMLKWQTKDKWTTSGTQHSIETFIDLLKNDINDAEHERKIYPTPNPTWSKLEALKKLLQRNDIIITNVDKGEAVVIMHTDIYTAECQRQLNNTDSYKTLENDPRPKNNKFANDTIQRFKNDRYIIKNIPQKLITT